MDKKLYHHKNLKNDLIEKGIELVNEYGLSQVSLRKVAYACNVSHAAPYSHFANKEELFKAMQSYVTEQFTLELEKSILEYKGKPEFLLEFSKAYISFFINKPQYFYFLFQQESILIDLDINSNNENNYKPFIMYKEQVLNLLDTYDIPQNKKQDLVIALFAYVHGIVSLATMKNIHYNEKWEDKLTDLIEIFKSQLYI